MTLSILNKCEEVRPFLSTAKLKFRHLKDMSLWMLHRVDPLEMADNLNLQTLIEPNALGLARAFMDLRCGTGGVMPYTLVVRRDGVIEQALELTVMSPHAKMLNRRALAVAAIGNFEKVRPTYEQLTALRELGILLSGYFTSDSVPLWGHTELPGTTNDLSKVCPGRLLDLRELRALIAANMRYRAEVALKEAGMVFS